MFKQRSLSIRAIVAVLTLWQFVCSPVVGQEAEFDVEETGLESMLFEEIPVVISASRQPQKLGELSVPVSVITAEDIHYSGLTTIPELLYFVTGMDVLPMDRNRWAVGVRGLHDTVTDRTLLLVDGRAASSIFTGGLEFLQMPILMEDIERIEVVRGPGGAAWGANAFNGVINIITKEPEDVLGVLAGTTINEFGDTYSHMRWAAKANKWSWRLSLGYEEHESSDEAIEGDDFFSRDFGRNTIMDGKFVYDASPQTKLSMGLGYSHIERGDYDFVAYFPKKDERLETVRAFARLDHEFDNGNTGYLQWFTNYRDIMQLVFANYRSVENDLEGQLNFQLGDGHNTSIGGNARWVYTDERGDDPLTFQIIDGHQNDLWGGLFLVDRWDMTDRLAVEGQFRGDHYNGTGFDWSGRLSTMYALDDDKRHVLRLSGARAFRAPLLVLRKSTAVRVPVAPGIYLGRVAQGHDLQNEEIWSGEVGYSGQLTKKLSFRADAYYQRYNHLIGFVTTNPEIFPGVEQTVFTPKNKGKADTKGMELELAWKEQSWRLSAWYALNEIDVSPYHDIRSYLPARQKVGLTARLFLPDDWIINANCRYSGITIADLGPEAGDADIFRRIDLNVSKKFANGSSELMFGVNDLLDETDLPIGGIGDFYNIHETPGQTFFVRLQLKF